MYFSFQLWVFYLKKKECFCERLQGDRAYGHELAYTEGIGSVPL